MKKLSIIMSIVLCVSCIAAYKQVTAQAKMVETVIESKVGKVLKCGGLSKIILIGTYQNKGQYAENVRIEVRDVKTDKLILTITPKTNSGYKPTIILENFSDENNDGLKQIFLGMDSGGSGGYGYFYVYDVASGKVETVFDYEKWNKSFTANYEDHYKVKIVEENQPFTQMFIIDISSRNKEYLDKIYNPNGTLKTVHKQAYVSALNYVFPYYNSTQAKFQLQVYQRIIGLYNADGLGFVVTFFDIYNQNSAENYTVVGTFNQSSSK